MRKIIFYFVFLVIYATIIGMEVENNIHQGHRKRVLDKALKYTQTFNDHELLEALLFYAIPRIDTNELAHRLLRLFGSLDKVFSAPLNSLLAVDGIGQKTATFIKLIGEVVKRSQAKKEKALAVTTPEVLNKIIANDFVRLTSETCAVYLLDKSFKVISKIFYECGKRFSVELDLNELVNAFSIHKPSHVILVHNHLGESVSPSNEDNYTTKKINVICSLHGVNLIDHVIISGEKKFSYRDQGLMDMIKNEANINNVLNSGGIR